MACPRGTAGRTFAIGTAALGGAVWLGAFPAVPRGPDGLMDATSAAVFFGGTAEMQPVRSPAGAAQYLLGGGSGSRIGQRALPGRPMIGRGLLRDRNDPVALRRQPVADSDP
jgi:hypothetical protein